VSDSGVVLAEIRDLLKQLLRVQLAPIVAAEVRGERLEKLYELTGTATADSVAKELSMSKGTVIATWQRWEQCGLLVREGRLYRKALD
jgi:hypothetical protein